MRFTIFLLFAFWQRRMLPVSLVMIALVVSGSVAAHDPQDGQPHSHLDDEAGVHPATNFFTTRSDARVLPLADAEDVFHFVIYGDRTGGVPAGLKVLEQAVADTNLLDPDLVMTVGDLIQGYNETPQWMEQAVEYRTIMQKLRMQWYPVAGNHDVYWQGSGPAPPGHHESNYEKHFGPLWYSFTHKNAGFLVLYSDEGDPATNEKGFDQAKVQTMSDEQLDFVQQALDDLTDMDHVFVFIHHPRWIGGGYAGGNWDLVHEKFKDAGNVSGVFAGHIHHMRFDGSKSKDGPSDGIAYYTLATTGGSLAADIPGAGYLHHLNIVTVRKNSFSVSALPVGAVIDPTEFTPEFLQQIELARSIRPRSQSGAIQIQADGSASNEVAFSLANPCDHRIEGTVVFGDPARSISDWSSNLDHHHFEIAPGESVEFSFHVSRLAGETESLSLPKIQTTLNFVGQSARIRLPSIDTPLRIGLDRVPADYFTGRTNKVLDVTSELAAVRVESADFSLPNGPVTLEAWLKPTKLAGYRGVIAKTESSEFAIFSDEGAPLFDIFLGDRYVTAKSSTPLPTDRWSHVAGIYDGEAVKLFVDGKLVSSVTGSGQRRTNDLPLFIGADPDRSGNPTRSFLGKIDEVRLSSSAIYSENFTPARRLKPTDSSILMMHMDRKFGPFLLDHSPSAANGILGRSSRLIEPK